MQGPLPMRRSRAGSALVFALLLHAALLWWLLRRTALAAGAATPSAMVPLRPGGGGGGGGPREVYISPPRGVPAVAVAPVQVPHVQSVVPPPVRPAAPPERQAPQVPDQAPAAVAGPDSGSGGGPGSGTGTGGGTGAGTGPGAGAGTGAGTDTSSAPIKPPVWRAGAVLTEGVPKDLRGQKVLVTFHVTAVGKVERVEVTPPIADQAFARLYDDLLREYLFAPARTAAGVAVPGITTLTFTLPTR